MNTINGASRTVESTYLLTLSKRGVGGRPHIFDFVQQLFSIFCTVMNVIMCKSLSRQSKTFHYNHNCHHDNACHNNDDCHDDNDDRRSHSSQVS